MSDLKTCLKDSIKEIEQDLEEQIHNILYKLDLQQYHTNC